MNVQIYDINVNDFPKTGGEADDSPRIMRAVEACAGGVLYVPKGVYLLESPVAVKNCCSLLLHKSAVLKAVKKMDYVLVYDAAAAYAKKPEGDANGTNSVNSANGVNNANSADSVDYDSEDWNLFVTGGVLDGNGLASCMSLLSFRHFTLRDTSFRNGAPYGLRTEDEGSLGTYELVASNLYFKCTMPGLAGNVAVSSRGGDSHFIDCICVDYTIGFDMIRGGSNRLTRCHVWGGPIPPRKEGEYPEMLADSVNFRIKCTDTILTDCYADTGKIGFEILADTRLLGCSYFNNYIFKLDDIVVIKHHGGRLVVSDGYFRQTSPNAVLYEGCGENVVWRDNILLGGLELPGE